MKKPAIALLSIVFVALIACSVQSVTADHLESGDGIFIDENRMNLVSTIGSKYQVHLQVENRNAQGQLISVSGAVHGKYLLHEMTDYIVDTEALGFFGEKEIIIIDNIKYEKVQYTVTYEAYRLPNYSSIDFLTSWAININADIDGHGLTSITLFQAYAPLYLVAEDDVLTFHWTILRIIN